ncbi:cytochrome B [Spirosoma utsteinense]|uniref:Membrane protein n=1 Tax=Spirosoma utsteinense TaxID=2585773 RepID=A0ABR6WC02_9BACT|nr:cytochrome B [Spirosoma utsteinense]MBC3784058.1 putative membrane protein [Spirosoma utsteinense]MBC3793452.1 putative membrane protein [Spirosoma utsteinense]
MYSGLVHAHSGLRWIALILLVVAVIVSIGKWQGRSGYTDGNRKLYLFTLIAVHTQLIIGLVLYFISPKVNFSLMSDKIYRFYTVEHTTGMLIAIILITIGYSRSKRATDPVTKQRLVGIFYGIGLLLILASIPWPFRIPGAGWF